jgi:hypothetical protein
MTTGIIFDVLPVRVANGALVAVAPPGRETVPGATAWEAIGTRWIATGGCYSARRTVHNYDAPYAVIEHPGGWVALYAKGSE